jgi:hypothetical protein
MLAFFSIFLAFQSIFVYQKGIKSGIIDQSRAQLRLKMKIVPIRTHNDLNFTPANETAVWLAVRLVAASSAPANEAAAVFL